MNARVASRLVCLALAAGALGGCGEEEQPSAEELRAAQPDTYVPASPRSRAPTEDVCDPHESASDAGDAKPSRDDVRTLVLRLDDLPEGARFEPNSGGVGTFTFEGHAEDLERAGLVSVGSGTFHMGRREPERQPGAPEPPPSCLPRTAVESGAMVFRTAAGTERRPLERLASMTVGSGIGPIGERESVTESPVDVGDEAALVEAPSDRDGTVNRTIVWRDGPLVGMVKVEGRGGAADMELLERLALRQADYLEAAAR